MRLLLVTERYWPEPFLITDLVAGLCERGHHVDVVTAMPNYPGGRYYPGYRPWGPLTADHAGVAVRRVPVVPRGRGRPWRLALNYLSFVASASVRLLGLGRGRWDVILVFQPSPVTTALPALLYRAVSGIPVAMWVQDLWPESIVATGAIRKRWLIEAAGWLSGAIYRSCDLLLGQSRAFEGRLRAARVPPGKIGYLPNWAEDSYKVSQTVRPAAPWARGFPVLFAGNLGRVQALDTVVEAARLLRHAPDIRWVFAGDGAMRGWLEDAVRAAGVHERFEFLGRLPRDEMPALFRQAGALLVSLKQDEAMALTVPSKVQAYMAAGCPILASLDGEGARIVEEAGAGFASKAGDAEGLAGNVLRMKALPAQTRVAMGERGRDYYLLEFDRTIGLDRLETSLARLARPRS